MGSDALAAGSGLSRARGHVNGVRLDYEEHGGGAPVLCIHGAGGSALVVLEPDASCELAPAAAEWVDAVVDRLREVGARDGVDAVAQALIGEVAGEHAWRSFPTRFGAGSRATDRHPSRSCGANRGLRPRPPPSRDGGHLIDPASPEVVAFIEKVLEGR